jgi:type IX secretion system PorP/SprF family membrane protein
MRIPLLILFIGFSYFALVAQDIPLFSQKLTNSSLYNPATAGNTFGSATFSYRSNYSGVNDAPSNGLLSLHTPFSNHRFGAGINIYQETGPVFKSTFYSAAFAYHLPFNKFAKLSLGVGAEYNQFGINGVTQRYILEDPKYISYQNSGKPDFSFGMFFQNRFVKVGASANRLSTAWLDQSNSKLLSNFYTSFVQGMIPLRDGQDLLEPYISFRQFSESNQTFDVGLYYTYNNKLTAGAAYRSGSLINGTLAYRISKYLLVGVSSEIILSPIGGNVGTSNEFTLRYDFNEQNYQKKYRKEYNQSIAYRRKTLTTSSIKKNPGGRSPKQLKKAQRRVAPYSPNSRYQNMKKLSLGKKTSRKPSFNKKRKPSNKKFNNHKIRKRR